MPVPVIHVFNAFCDRCGIRYLAGQWPNHGLCAGCYRGAEAAARVRSRVA